MFHYKNKNKNNIIYDRQLIDYFKKIGFPLLFIFKDQTPELCLEAVQQKYYTQHGLQNTLNKTNELCKAAVEKDGMTLKYVKHQNDELCIIAVKQNGLALQYVKNKNYNICLEAIKQNPMALQYININDDNDDNYRLYLENYKNFKNINELNDICTICLSNDKNKCCEIIECKHSFHIKCLLKWVKNNHTCPNCRINIL